MKLVIKNLWQLLMMKKNIEKPLEWRIIKKVIIKKNSLIEEGKKVGTDEVIN